MKISKKSLLKEKLSKFPYISCSLLFKAPHTSFFLSIQINESIVVISRSYVVMNIIQKDTKHIINKKSKKKIEKNFQFVSVSLRSC